MIPLAPDRERLEQVLAAVERGQSIVLTGAIGGGKTHLLRAAQVALQQTGLDATIYTGNDLGADIPLGAFAGAAGLPEGALYSPASIIDAFTRRRSSVVLLVDDVDALDDASLYVVTQLITTASLRAILTTRDLIAAPPAVQSLYDNGALVETVVGPLPDDEALALVQSLLGATITPAASASILAAGGGNPLHIREIVRGSIDGGQLIKTPHGWDLHGVPSTTPRLAQLIGDRFCDLDQAALDAATLFAIAGEYPLDVIGDRERIALIRADIVEETDHGWGRLSHPLDRSYLRSRCTPALWRNFTHEVVRVLRSPETEARPHARRRADVLALDHDLDIDADAMIALAEHALGAFDEVLSLRAANAAVEAVPGSVHAHRIAGLAASALGHIDVADVHLGTARRLANTDSERTAVALAQAQHLGLRRHDAIAAGEVIQGALLVVSDKENVAHLHRAGLRWGALAGQPQTSIAAPEHVDTAEAAMGLIMAGVSGVISGPLHETMAVLPRLRRIPAELLALVPGGGSLVDLTEVMALSYSGDVLATRRQLTQLIASARENRPESLGIWEYALGFLEFLSADGERAYTLGCSAASHLAWRDTTGLLPVACCPGACRCSGKRNRTQHRGAQTVRQHSASGWHRSQGRDAAHVGRGMASECRTTCRSGGGYAP